ncbi:short-chain dehydrogenase [Nocardioides flavus (ex Wang et al. 2016)]|uniref:Short-chain dehydrogenase n=1 Tax=Nocardioides flavus (ex Wang et al. 2016) TaxID=2058780 RepID=A0ABQ3HGJ9_9ACTN|nr:glucose 1-dehydrogenase [Nocardioides flavus (ex Wang et al. 2016)]GHE16745.1 short-chain dehydrogenase [Nocardioides flavus (ex Wang et al. 2016)]
MTAGPHRSTATFDLRNQKIWVTGASRGLGRAIALGFAASGADVALTARSAEAVEGVAGEVRDLGREALVLTGSVSDGLQVRAAVAEMKQQWGRLDALVNCAGVSPVFKKAQYVEDEEWRHVIDVNVTGTFLCAREAGRLMLEAGGGAIVNISSIHGQVGMSRMAPYSASKGAVDALSRTLALEWAEHGVRVNALSPGYFETDMTEALREHDKWRAHLLERIPLGRFGVPDELVSAALFLASDASGFMTGSNVVVDGGWTAA